MALSSIALFVRFDNAGDLEKKLERKERNIIGLHEEEVDETAVEEHLAVVDVSVGWRLVDIWRLFIDICGVLDVTGVH